MDKVKKILRTEEDAILFERKLYLSSLFIFTKHFLRYQEVTKQVHGNMLKVLESPAKKKITVEPRGVFKTTVGAISYPAWRLLRNPNLSILLDSELYTNSKNTLRSIKGHFESPEMVRVFGNQIGKKWDEGEITIASRTNHAIKEASLTVGGIGTTKIGQHYDIIISDDLNSPENCETPEKAIKVIKHVQYNLSILKPGGEYCFLGTRYAERDVIGFLLSDVLGQKHLAEGKMKLVTPEEMVKAADQGDNFLM